MWQCNISDKQSAQWQEQTNGKNNNDAQLFKKKLQLIREHDHLIAIISIRQKHCLHENNPISSSINFFSPNHGPSCYCWHVCINEFSVGVSNPWLAITCECLLVKYLAQEISLWVKLTCIQAIQGYRRQSRLPLSSSTKRFGPTTPFSCPTSPKVWQIQL